MLSSNGRKAALCCFVFTLATAVLRTASADDAAPATPATEAPPSPPVAEAPVDVPPPASKPAPPPYSIPWQLRAAAATNAVRLDTAFAGYENAAPPSGPYTKSGGFTVASILNASVKIPGTGAKWAGLAPLVRVAVVNDSPPTGSGGFVFVNPIVGANYAVDLGSGLRAAFFLGGSVPIGGGGDALPAKSGAADARNAGIYARSAMDNSLFAVNDFAVIPGVDLAYVGGGVTVQAEATLFQLFRVRNDDVQKEATKTNFTTGLHVGYFLAAPLSIGAELRYQRWLNAPIAVDQNKPNTSVDTLTVALGPRFHIPLGGGAYARPGVAYAMGLNQVMSASAMNYHIVQVDIPVIF